MHKWSTVIGALAGSLLLAGIACLIPAQLASVDRAVIAQAGVLGPSNEAQLETALRLRQVGLARRLNRATQSNQGDFSSLIEHIRVKEPLLYAAGAPDPFYAQFLASLPYGMAVEARTLSQVFEPTLLRQVLPRQGRTALLDRLRRSNFPTVHSLLELRTVNGLQRLYPADHAAGAPYEAGLLLLASLLEGGHFKENVQVSIATVALAAVSQQRDAVRQLEAWVSANLSLATQLDYGSLLSLARLVDSMEDWLAMAALFRVQEKEANQIYAALIYTQAPASVAEYLNKHPDSAIADLEYALHLGPGAVQFLIESQQPIYQAEPISAFFLDGVAQIRPAFLNTFVVKAGQWALLLKLGALILSAWYGLQAVAYAFRTTSDRGTLKLQPLGVGGFCKILSTGFVAVMVCVFLEPDLLHASVDSNESLSGLSFVPEGAELTHTPPVTMEEFNRITLLILALFFILQLVIYSFCLIKIREIQAKELSSATKLKLLDNEEHLFDFGLYVGLGGTVLSLICLAMGIVESSLMAAYASTLFGILFTALLKVQHLRPFRGRLLLEADRL